MQYCFPKGSLIRSPVCMVAPEGHITRVVPIPGHGMEARMLKPCFMHTCTSCDGPSGILPASVSYPTVPTLSVVFLAMCM